MKANFILKQAIVDPRKAIQMAAFDVESADSAGNFLDACGCTGN